MAYDGAALVYGGLNRAVTDRTKATEREAWLTMAGGRILGTYQQNLTINQAIQSMTIRGCQSYVFPIHGRASGSWEVPGEYKTGLDSIRFQNRTVNVDRPILFFEEAWDYDQALAYYDAKLVVAAEQAKELARVNEQRAARKLALVGYTDGATGITIPSTDIDGNTVNIATATVRTATLTGITTRSALQTSDFTLFLTKIQELVVLIENAGMDIRDFVLGLTPGTFRKFAWSDAGKDFLDRDLTDKAGDIADGTLPTILGLKVQPSWGWEKAYFQNCTEGWSDAVHTASDFEVETYANNNTRLVGLLYANDAVLRLEALPLENAVFFDPRTETTCLKLRMACGFGMLKPERVFKIILGT